MDYPVEILPNNNYKIIDCDISEHFLIRYAPDANIWNEDLEMIFDKSICDPSSHMHDLSTSLLGVFIVDNIFLELTPNGRAIYNHYCLADSMVEIPLFNEHFVFNQNRGYWFLKISDVFDLKAIYKVSEDNFTATCKVCHTPMKWNFWHFSIRWYLESKNCFWNELPINEQKKNWSDRLSHETRSIIKMFALTNIPEVVSLDDVYYKINP